RIASQSKKSTSSSLTKKAQMLMMRTKIVTKKSIARGQLPKGRATVTPTSKRPKTKSTIANHKPLPTSPSTKISIESMMRRSRSASAASTTAWSWCLR
ncbi:hypothetical protein AAVH_39791, partial [Aphelenchoides avenae]